MILCVLAALLALVATTQPVSAADGRPYANPLKSFLRQWTWLNNDCQQWRLVPAT
ncbi:hypothetical protein [Streptomyces chartreusis]|uniref:hypothetical protein n=1 Tax=Streptomyces chartreusis TaxID=1969 RepID=UPI0036513CA8